MKIVFLLYTCIAAWFIFGDTPSYNTWKTINKHTLISDISSYESYKENANHMLFNYHPKNSYQLAMNKFAGYNRHTFDKYFKGYKPKFKQDNRNFVSFNEPFPSTVDWRNSSIVGPVKDQGQCGSCWAFSAVGALESQVMKKLNVSISLSEQDMVDCVKNISSPDGSTDCCSGCEGGEMYAVYQYLSDHQKGSDDTERQYPYTATDQNCKSLPSSVKDIKLSAYVSLPSKNETAMAAAVYHIGPLSIGVNANQDWQLYQKGIYNPTPDQCNSSPEYQDHGVIVVGYGSENGLDYWVIRNSWGADWGEAGYIRLARGNNSCGVSDSVTYPIVEKIKPENQCLNTHRSCSNDVCHTECPCSCFIPTSTAPCDCSSAICDC